MKQIKKFEKKLLTYSEYGVKMCIELREVIQRF